MIPTMHATNEAALARVTAEADANARLIADLLEALNDVVTNGEKQSPGWYISADVYETARDVIARAEGR